MSTGMWWEMISYSGCRVFFAMHDVVLIVEAGRGRFNVPGFTLHATAYSGPDAGSGRGQGVLAYVRDKLQVVVKPSCGWKIEVCG